MTIKELAEFTGKNQTTIQRWTKKAECKMQSIADKMQSAGHGKITDFSIDEIECIMQSGSMSKDAVRILMENARRENREVSNVVNYEMIGKMIGMAVTAALSPIVDRLDKISVPQLPAPINEDYYSLVAYCSLKKISIDRSQMPLHGRELKKLAASKNMSVHSIPDERWGKVNSYPVEILNEYFYEV